MTLLNLEPRHEVAVLEMSMYTVGEIARLAEIARPEVGVVLAVHPTHLERAGSIEADRAGQGRAAARRSADGLAVLNADDPRVAAMRDVTAATVRTFGLGARRDVRATEVESHGVRRHRVHPAGPVGRAAAPAGTPGRHLVPHALAAATVAEHFALPLDEVAAALAQGSHAPHRMELVEAAERGDDHRRHLQRVARLRGGCARLPGGEPARLRAVIGTRCSATCSSWGLTRSASTAQIGALAAGVRRRSWRWARAAAGSARRRSRGRPGAGRDGGGRRRGARRRRAGPGAGGR